MKNPLDNLGDTIVEVIICIAILGTAMAVAYVSTSHSLQLSTDAGNRSRAAGYLQQQIELIKLAEQSSSGNLGSYIAEPGHPFCIDIPSGGKVSADSTGVCGLCVDDSQSVVRLADHDGNCSAGHPSISISIKYDDTTKVFTATAGWGAPNGSGQDQSVFYYKLADNSVSALPPSGTSCTPQLPNLVQNPDFNPAFNPGTGVGAGLTNVSTAKFASGIPFRGFNVYPDDHGSVGPNTGWSGGYSLRAGYYSDKPGSPGYVSGYLEQYPFPGDTDSSHWPYNPATGSQVPVGSVNTWYYSNPVQGISQPKGWYPPDSKTSYTGMIWQQTISGLSADTKYIFSAYFDNLYSTTEPAAYSPNISFEINGTALFNQRVLAVKSEPKSASTPWQYLYGAYTTNPGQTSITISVIDNEGQIKDDDFAMTHFGLYECKAGS